MEILEIQWNGDTGQGQATVRFPRSSPVFEGHFPHAPILPGVALIDAAVQIAAQATRRKLQLSQLSNAKFCRVVEPDQAVVLSFKVSPDPADASRVKVAGKWSREGAKIAELQFAAVMEGGGDGPEA
jgi:3-hydroxyacyl-[acyl-carrier-protein] dehydratase